MSNRRPTFYLSGCGLNEKKVEHFVLMGLERCELGAEDGVCSKNGRFLRPVDFDPG